MVRILFVLLAMLISPHVTHAQADLESTIRAAILEDPRTAQMGDAQIESVVEALAQSARQQGLTPSDITWRPRVQGTERETSVCAPFPAPFCVFGLSFGLFGGDYLIALWLALSSLLLMLIVGLSHHHRTIARA